MKLLCLDFANLVIRHSANPYNTAVDLQQRPVGGAVGALGQSLRLIEEEKPTHLLVGKDGSRSEGFRRQLEASYKAHRADADEALLHQFGVAYKGIEILDWPVMAMPGYEADDVIASAATAFPGEVLVITGDKDMLALCSEKTIIRLLRPGGYRDCRPEDCQDIFGVTPEHVCDYKALVGDTSDGISGVPGIGPKSALALLAEHDGLEDILLALDAGTDIIPGAGTRVTKILREHRQKAETSYSLAELICDLDLGDADTLACPPVPDDDSIGEALAEAGLHDLRRRLPGGEKHRPAPVSAGTAFDQALRQMAKS